MKIANHRPADHVAKSENRPIDDEFGGPLVEKSALFCLIIAIIILAFSAASVIARVNSPEDSSLIASSPNVNAGRAVTCINRAYFVVDDGIHGEELWSSDGTDAGTFLLGDINPGSPGSGVHNLTVAGAQLFFSADDGAHGFELWRTDDTSAGTVLVKDISSGFAGSSFGHMQPFQGRLYFNVNSQFWKSDGTSQGTTPATDFAPGISENNFISADFAVLGSRAFFTAITPSAFELWLTDGTASDTQFLRSVVPNDQIFVEVPLVSPATGNLVFFDAFDPATATELYVTDGTPAGTRLVRDFYPNQSDAFVTPLFLTGVSGAAFFSADEGISGRELWISRGTSGDPLIVHDFLRD
jgi:ELWxxDGT repeat protein